MFREFLAVAEAKDDRFHVLVMEQCARQSSICGWSYFLGEIDDVGVALAQPSSFSQRVTS